MMRYSPLNVDCVFEKNLEDTMMQLSDQRLLTAQ